MYWFRASSSRSQGMWRASWSARPRAKRCSRLAKLRLGWLFVFFKPQYLGGGGNGHTTVQTRSSSSPNCHRRESQQSTTACLYVRASKRIGPAVELLSPLRDHRYCTVRLAATTKTGQ